MVIGGAGAVVRPEFKVWLDETLATEGLAGFAAAFESQGLTDIMRKRLFANDVEALRAFARRAEDEDTVTVFRALSCPFLIIGGTDDPGSVRIEAFAELLVEWQTHAGPVTEASIREAIKRFGL